MGDLQFIVLQQENDTFSLNIFRTKKNLSITPHHNETNIDKIKEAIHSFPENLFVSVIRLHIKAPNILDDKLFIFFKSSLPANITIEPLNHIKTDYVYKVARDKMIILVTDQRWKKILEAHDQVHTAHHNSGHILQSIYNLSGKLYLSFVSTIPARELLPPKCLQKFVSLHTSTEKALPTVLWCKQGKQIYRIKDYPRCVLLKLCPQMSLDLASKWMHKVISLFSVLYFVCDKFACTFDTDKEQDYGEFVAVLDCEEGTFITNKYYNANDYELIGRVHEPHFTSRWAFSGGSSVVGSSGTVYYGVKNIQKLHGDSISRKASLFLEAILTSRTWFDSSLEDISSKTTLIEQYNFTEELYRILINEPIFDFSAHSSSNYNLDTCNIAEKISDLTFVSHGKLYVYYGIRDKSNNSLNVSMLPVESFIEFFASALYEGQEAMKIGFIYHITTLLFNYNGSINLEAEL